jgi:hypothetical protein
MIPLRHRCRNLHCRMKLPAPVENEHHAFCCKGCFESFYLNRCRVCERDLRKTGKLGDAGRLYCRPPAKCAAEAQKWPEKYGDGSRAGFSISNVRSAHSTGLKIGIAGDRPAAHCLREWGWGGDPENGDHSLYDRDALTIARIVLEADGRYRLRTPTARPHVPWADLDEAKRRAESLALAAIPLAAVSPKIAARLKRDNEAPHPLLRSKLPTEVGEGPAAPEAAKRKRPPE